jgi:hypothetical protein
MFNIEISANNMQDLETDKICDYLFIIDFVNTPPYKKPLLFFNNGSLKLRVTLSNFSKDTLYFEKPFYGDNLVILVTDSNGNDIQKTAPIRISPQITYDYFKTLAPGDSFQTEIDLTNYNKSLLSKIK